MQDVQARGEPPRRPRARGRESRHFGSNDPEPNAQLIERLAATKPHLVLPLLPEPPRKHRSTALEPPVDRRFVVPRSPSDETLPPAK